MTSDEVPDYDYWSRLLSKIKVAYINPRDWHLQSEGLYNQEETPDKQQLTAANELTAEAMNTSKTLTITECFMFQCAVVNPQLPPVMRVDEGVSHISGYEKNLEDIYKMDQCQHNKAAVVQLWELYK